MKNGLLDFAQIKCKQIYAHHIYIKCGFKNTNMLEFTIQLQQPNFRGGKLKFTSSTIHITNV